MMFGKKLNTTGYDIHQTSKYLKQIYSKKATKRHADDVILSPKDTVLYYRSETRRLLNIAQSNLCYHQVGDELYFVSIIYSFGRMTSEYKDV